MLKCFLHRVPVFEQRIDNIVGIAYAMDLLDYVPKVWLLHFLFLVFVFFSLIRTP
jgi:CBS domain containing-hemolysin-like protein